MFFLLFKKGAPDGEASPSPYSRRARVGQLVALLPSSVAGSHRCGATPAPWCGTPTHTLRARRKNSRWRSGGARTSSSAGVVLSYALRDDGLRSRFVAFDCRDAVAAPGRELADKVHEHVDGGREDLTAQLPFLEG